MTSTSIEYTPNLNLSLLPANFHVWAQIMNDNLITLDAGINAFVRFHNLRGPWTNSTAYAVGDTVVDTADATLWTAVVAHNSAQIPTTFLEEKTARPNLWIPANTVAVARGVWTGPGTLYNVSDFVLADGTKYAICLVQHVSGPVFDDDVALGYWSVLIDFSQGIAIVDTGDEPPALPIDNQLWWSTTLGQLFVWYNDGNSSQWVPASVSETGGDGVAVGSSAPAEPFSGELWWNSTLGALFVWYDDGNSAQWVPATPQSGGITTSVMSFGAVGDGIADNTVAIQAAIDYVYALGGGVVNFPTGRYRVGPSQLTEILDNAGVAVPPSGYAILLRAGVSLVGQADRSAVIFVDAATPSLIVVAMVDPVDCTVEGFEIYTAHTGAVPRITQGVMTVSAEGAPARVCRGNTWRNLYLHNIGGYGIGIQNASPVNCVIDKIDLYNIGSAGIDLKARRTLSVPPIGNYCSNITCRDHGNTYDDAAIDVRGVWHLRNITVTEFGNKAGEIGYGIRFRIEPDAANTDFNWPDAARYSTLDGFYVKPTPSFVAPQTYGVFTSSDDVHISNGTAEGCTSNFFVIAGGTRIMENNTLTSCTSINALQFGCYVDDSTKRTRIIGFTSYNSVSVGIRNAGTDTHIIGATSVRTDVDGVVIGTEITPLLTDSGAATDTQVVMNSPTNGGIWLGSSTPAKLSISGPLAGSGSQYVVSLSSTIQSDVSAAVGVFASLSTAAAAAASVRHFQAAQGTVGAGSVPVDQRGFHVSSNLAAGALNYGFSSEMGAAANNWSMYMFGTAQNYLRGNTGIGTGKSLPTAALDITPSTTAQASLRISHGTAPTTPNDGDMWTTTAGLFVRINGVTMTVTLT